MSTASPQPVARAPMLAPAARSRTTSPVNRRASVWRLSRWALEQCSGARAGLWLARLAALPFAVFTFYTTRPLGEVIDAVARVACIMFSWCAGLAALSAAGPAQLQALRQLEGMFVARAVPTSIAYDERAVSVATWTWRHMAPLGLLVVSASAVGPEPWRATQLAGLGVGVLAYFLVLGAGLALLAHVCQRLTRSRGQSLLLALVFVPEVLAPAWPELPTVPRTYASILDACLALGARW